MAAQYSELTRIVDRISDANSRPETIEMIELAIHLEPTINDWPTQVSRQATRAMLLVWLGKLLRIGSREDQERALQKFAAAFGYLGPQHGAQWAVAKRECGLAYAERKIGDISENIEQSLACFTDALNVITPQYRVFITVTAITLIAGTAELALASIWSDPTPNSTIGL